jgi:hypothetical protein
MFVLLTSRLVDRVLRILRWLRAFALLEDLPVAGAGSACGSRREYVARRAPRDAVVRARDGVQRARDAPGPVSRKPPAANAATEADSAHPHRHPLDATVATEAHAAHPHRHPLARSSRPRRPGTPARPVAHCLTPIDGSRKPVPAQTRSRAPHLG